MNELIDRIAPPIISLSTPTPHSSLPEIVDENLVSEHSLDPDYEEFPKPQEADRPDEPDFPEPSQILQPASPKPLLTKVFLPGPGPVKGSRKSQLSLSFPRACCIPQPQLCCQPPPPISCCPPPPPCCSQPVIPPCQRACPSCPCRRRMVLAIRRLKRQSLFGSCQQCSLSGEPYRAFEIQGGSTNCAARFPGFRPAKRSPADDVLKFLVCIREIYKFYFI
ncbi:unnamed protein product, partial [Mesorhabditis belari]|uniref:Uncharacterized protein n=1 Tax=Mesorhabditis belari TaxID=2138241 RepID=A0AAF3EI41_9BILA